LITFFYLWSFGIDTGSFHLQSRLAASQVKGAAFLLSKWLILCIYLFLSIAFIYYGRQYAGNTTVPVFLAINGVFIAWLSVYNKKRKANSQHK